MFILLVSIFLWVFHGLSHLHVEYYIFNIGEFPLQGIMVTIGNKLCMYTLLIACSSSNQCNCFLCFPKKYFSFTVLTPIKYQNMFGFGIPDAWQRKLTEEPVNTYMESDKKSIIGITVKNSQSLKVYFKKKILNDILDTFDLFKYILYFLF